MSQTDRVPTKTSVVLPGDNYVLQVWKAKPGALVQSGETIAMACTKEAASKKDSSTAGGSNASVASTGHKRPNRRRKINAAAAKNLSTSDGASKPSNKAFVSSENQIASMQQRLAQKLASSDQSKALITDQSTSSDATEEKKTALGASSPELIPIHAAATGLLRLGKIPADDQQSNLTVGYIEECLHPTFLDGLCVVCGSSMNQSDNNSEGRNLLSAPIDPTASRGLSSASRKNLSQVTVSGGITMTISAQESQAIANRDIDRLRHQAKLSLVLDLDHTLVHATADPRAHQFYSKDDLRTLRLPLMEGGLNPQPSSNALPTMYMQHYVKLRPHIKTFLNSVRPDYELTVYTAGTRQYAEEITIMLCRHLVGSKYDMEDLERLRYQVHVAEVEYKKIQSLNAADDAPVDDLPRKRKAEEATGDQTVGNNSEEPAKKRKKVSFGAPKEESLDQTDSQNDKANLKSDHMTKEKLETLRKELENAEALEKEAWDLRKKMFGSRVVSRTDVGDLGKDVKSLRRIFPCGGTMAAVVDDREDVWANAKDNSTDTIKGEPPDNLLLVRPYHWRPFVGFADVNNAAGADLSGNGPGSEKDSDVETDVQLVWTSRILKGLHRRYYRQDESNRKTVPELLRDMRLQVLKDATIVLSGLVPLHKQNVQAQKARPPFIRYAQSLGATITSQVRDGVTHVVAAKDGTDKCIAARKIPGCVLVRAAWLVECYWSMTRRDIVPHQLGQGGPAQENRNVTVGKPVPSETLDEGESDSGSDSEDDDFAAELENEMMES